MGIFLAIEGAKGAGKTTLAAALRERLADAADEQVVVTKEPTARFDLGQESCLLGADLARAITADRAAHVREVIAPALGQEKSVVCDRYILSSLVFHSADGVPAEELWQLNRPFPLPAANLILAVPASVISARRERRGAPTRLETASDPSREHEGYLRFAKAMRRRGVPFAIVPNENPADLERAVRWIMRSIQEGIPS